MEFDSGGEILRIHSDLIKDDMGRILSFICRFLEPASEAEDSPFLDSEGQQYRNKSSHYYVMITIWFLVSNGVTLPQGSVNTLVKQGSRLAKMVPDDNSHFGQDESAKTALLKWYYYNSILRLVDSGFLHSSWCVESTDAVASKRLLNDKVRRLRRAAKVTLAAAVSSKRPYSPRDEIVDRLAFLESELGLDEYEAQISFLATSRIRGRAFTKSINPGYLDYGKKGDTSAPWETYSLCHHSRLVLADRDRHSISDHLPGIQEMEVYRAKLSLFLTTDASLIPCWDRKSTASCEAWLHSEPTAVLATTLLDIYIKDMEMSSQEQVKPNCKPEVPSSLRQQPDLDGDRRINWQSFRPPRRYHPPDVAQSLQDTPHKYHESMMKLIRIPNNMKALWETKHSEGGEWSVQRLRKSGVADKVSLLDIMAFDPNIQDTSPRVLGRLGSYKAVDFDDCDTPGKPPSLQPCKPEKAKEEGEQDPQQKKEVEDALAKSVSTSLSSAFPLPQFTRLKPHH